MGDAFDDLNLLFKQVAVKRMVEATDMHKDVMHGMHRDIKMAMEDLELEVDYLPIAGMGWHYLELSTEIHNLLPYHKSPGIIHDHPFGDDYESGRTRFQGLPTSLRPQPAPVPTLDIPPPLTFEPPPTFEPIPLNAYPP